MERTRGRQTLGYMMVFGAASLWGTLGVVSRNLYVGGLSAQAVVTLRASMAAALLLAALTVLRPATLRVRLRDIPLFAAYGLVSVAAFYLLYFLTIQHLSVAAAAVLDLHGPRLRRGGCRPYPGRTADPGQVAGPDADDGWLRPRRPGL